MCEFILSPQYAPNTSKVIDSILSSGKVEQQSYRSCMGLLKLAEKHTPSRLEKACECALSYNARPSYKSIKNLLAAMKENQIASGSEESNEELRPHGITRGARYYGGTES